MAELLTQTIAACLAEMNRAEFDRAFFLRLQTRVRLRESRFTRPAFRSLVEAGVLQFAMSITDLSLVLQAPLQQVRRLTQSISQLGWDSDPQSLINLPESQQVCALQSLIVQRINRLFITLGCWLGKELKVANLRQRGDVFRRVPANVILLSTSEFLYISALYQGLPRDEIATVLGLPRSSNLPKTFYRYNQQVLKKLTVSNIAVVIRKWRYSRLPFSKEVVDNLLTNYRQNRTIPERGRSR